MDDTGLSSAWRGKELRGATQSWTHTLHVDERAELTAALDKIEQMGRAITAWSPADFRFSAVSVAARRWRDALKNGIGFVLIKGVPIAGYPESTLRALYWTLGAFLGSPVPQNSAGDLLCDIRDTGADPRNANTRLYTTRAEQDFHTDAADIIGLLCLKSARSGGTSRIVSSVSVLREFERRRPDLLPLLYRPWPFHNHGQAGPDGPTHFMMPIVRAHEAGVASFFLGWYVRRSQELTDAPRLSAAQLEALALYEQIANDPALYLDMDFEPGDIQWLKNSVILHKRTEYEDWPEQDRKRHLLRLWLAARDFEDGDERLRSGVKPVK
ncbi:conserved hypothetical protein [uncultured Defluviicoccus sp.]|uniref:TauD/TfdA-like domain-containing protein n=1 Tax=metagenome TaxID=256318 RepID=A0A380T7I9_9ZZZZ|nr:conserved hypothetical protein [uncultured Defluviicoccus sp.]